MSPWQNTARNPEELWHTWWAWHPVIIDDEDLRGIVWLEDVLRRRVRGKWEYKLLD